MIPEYPELWSTVLARGLQIDSRHGPTREVLGQQVVFQAGEMVTRKGLNRKLGWMEVLQFIAELFDLEAIKAVAPNADHSLFTNSMAYGPRVRNMWREARSKLEADPDTRQAIVFIGSPADGMSNDLTCTLTMQFLIRRGKLYTNVSMRSWDLAKGMPLDIMMFSGANLMLARTLNVKPGNVIVTAGSAHIYQSDNARVPTGGTYFFDFMPQLVTLDDFHRWAASQIGAYKQSPDNWPNGVPAGIIVR